MTKKQCQIFRAADSKPDRGNLHLPCSPFAAAAAAAAGAANVAAAGTGAVDATAAAAAAAVATVQRKLSWLFAHPVQHVQTHQTRGEISAKHGSRNSSFSLCKFVVCLVALSILSSLTVQVRLKRASRLNDHDDPPEVSSFRNITCVQPLGQLRRARLSGLLQWPSESRVGNDKNAVSEAAQNP